MPGKKLPEAMAHRVFTNMFICMNCNCRVRANPSKVAAGKIKCRNCGNDRLRLKAKERRGQKA